MVLSWFVLSGVVVTVVVRDMADGMEMEARVWEVEGDDAGTLTEAVTRGGRRVREFRTLNKPYGFGC